MSRGDQKTAVTAEYLQKLFEARSSIDPVPELTHKAENRVRRELKDVALRGCDDQVRALAKCAEGKTLSVVWYCRKFSKAIDLCMHEYGQDEALKDELRRRHGANFPHAVKGYREASNVTKQDDPSP